MKLNKQIKMSLAAATIGCLSISQQADAALTWHVSEAGGNVTMTTSGSLDIGSLSGAISSTFSSSAEGVSRPGGTGWQYINNSGGNATWYRHDSNLGIQAAPVISTGSFAPDSVSGDSFGQRNHGNGNSSLIWDTTANLTTPATPGVISPNSTMVFNGTTIATMFGTNLDSGPVLLWTAPSTDTISIALVPEPSSTALLGLGGLTLLLRRRR